jgi:hypothetical protein
MINYAETQTYKVLIDYDWEISERILWSLFVVTFKAKTEEEFADGVVKAVESFEMGEDFSIQLCDALISDLKACLK